MLITVDGKSGAGKTTQQLILEQKLGLPLIDLSPVWGALETISMIACPHKTQPYTRYLSKIQSIYAAPQECIIENLWEAMDWLNEVDGDNIDNHIETFRKGISYLGRTEPDVSIYLWAPTSVSYPRAVRRSYPNSEMTMSEDDSSLQEDDARRYKLWKHIEWYVPYFHVIDASASIDEVANAIDDKLPRRL